MLLLSFKGIGVVEINTERWLPAFRWNNFTHSKHLAFAAYPIENRPGLRSAFKSNRIIKLTIECTPMGFQILPSLAFSLVRLAFHVPLAEPRNANCEWPVELNAVPRCPFLLDRTSRSSSSSEKTYNDQHPMHTNVLVHLLISNI